MSLVSPKSSIRMQVFSWDCSVDSSSLKYMAKNGIRLERPEMCHHMIVNLKYLLTAVI